MPPEETVAPGAQSDGDQRGGVVVDRASQQNNGGQKQRKNQTRALPGASVVSPGLSASSAGLVHNAVCTATRRWLRRFSTPHHPSLFSFFYPHLACCERRASPPRRGRTARQSPASLFPRGPRLEERETSGGELERRSRGQRSPPGVRRGPSALWRAPRRAALLPEGGAF